MRLFELFDKIAPYEKTFEGSVTTQYSFETSSGELYVVSFKTITAYDPRQWYGKYENITEHSVEISFSKMGPSSYQIHVTNTGDSFEVMATVLNIIEEYLQTNTPPSLFFTGRRDEGGRTKLYDRLADKMKNLQGYHLIEKPTFGRNYLYIFKRHNNEAV